jgi:hypothetical protein
VTTRKIAARVSGPSTSCETGTASIVIRYASFCCDSHSCYPEHKS